MGVWDKIKGALKKTRDALGNAISSLFGRSMDEFYDGLEEALLSADISVAASESIIEDLKKKVASEKGKKRDKDFIVAALKDSLLDKLTEPEDVEIEYPATIILLGVNGVGKTTTAGKLSKYFTSQGKSVTLAAADTFRAAAAEQLDVWAKRTDVRMVRHEAGSDPSAVVYDAVTSSKARGADVTIVDTAGRLHVKDNLMEELKKICRVAERTYPEAHIYKILVLDGTAGHNSMVQAETFDDALDLDGAILTKLDSSAKGGFAVSLCSDLCLPIVFVGVGEKADDLVPFDAESFADGLI